MPAIGNNPGASAPAAPAAPAPASSISSMPGMAGVQVAQFVPDRPPVPTNPQPGNRDESFQQPVRTHNETIKPAEGKSRVQPKDQNEDDVQELVEDTFATDNGEEGAEQSAEEEVGFFNKDEQQQDETQQEEAEPAAAAVPTTRDYTKFDKEVAAVLKNVPNHVFNKFGQQIQDWKAGADKAAKLQEQLTAQRTANPGFLAEHPDGYRLTPDYRNIISEERIAKEEADFWSHQATAIANGEAWQEFRGYDDKGEPIIVDHPASQNGQVDTRASLLAQSQYAKAQLKADEFKARRAAYKSQWTKFQQDAAAELSEKSAKLFNNVTPDKLTGEDKAYYEKAIKALPDIYANHPLMPILGMAFVNFRKVVKNWQADRAKLTGKKPTPAVGPRGKTSGAALPNGNIADMSELDSLIRGR